MCIWQTVGWSNSRYFSRTNMQRMTVSHPCGHCAECIAQQRNEWYIRNYYQLKEVFANGGFSVEEVFTYEDGHLPHVTDFFDISRDEANFSCVDKKGVQQFLDRLNHLLKYRYFGANFGISHFICAEYGHDDVYMDDKGVTHEGTVRPHYHGFLNVMHPEQVVFYHVKTRITKRAKQFCAMLDIAPEDIKYYTTYQAVVRLTPEDFIRLVCEAWQNGNTMNYKRFDKSGVLSKHPHLSAGYRRYVFDDLTKADSDLRAVTSYITKYITKGDDYSAKIGKRAWYLSKLISEKKGTGTKDSFKEALKEVRSKIGLFKLFSDGFGKYFLDTVALAQRSKIESQGLFDMPDSQKVSREVPLPMYYHRKLFYNWRKDAEGHVQWYLTPYGLDSVEKILEARVYRVARKYRDIYANMDNESQNYVDYLLEGHRLNGEPLHLNRTPEDFVRYLLVYRGRILFPWARRKSENLPTVREVLDKNNRFDITNSKCLVYENDGGNLVERVTDSRVEVTSLKAFARKNCINQSTYFNCRQPFHDFDELYRFFGAWKEYLDTNKDGESDKEHTFRFKERLRDEIKTISKNVTIYS